MYIHYKYTNNMISPWASYAFSLQKNPQPNHLETAKRLGKQLQLGDGIVLNVQGVHKRNVKILMIE